MTGLGLRWLLAATCLTAHVGCSSEEPLSDSEQREGQGGAGGKFDLPNRQYFEREFDGDEYGKIAALFAAKYDLTVDLTKLKPSWPMRGDKTATLNHFGTPIQLAEYGYFHTAVDVFRSTVQESDEVVAPVSGDAMLIYWDGTPRLMTDGWGDYLTVVAIWDEESHVIAQLMHVVPTAKLNAASGFVHVDKGEVLGTLSPLPFLLMREHEPTLRHSHVDFIDGKSMVALDPARYLPYHDSVKPSVVGLYSLDATAKRHDTVVPGHLDLVLEAFDRDDDSQRNFDIAAVSYQLVGADGKVLHEVPRCQFSDLFSAVDKDYPARALNLIDFGSAHAQTGGNWPGSDLDDRNRTFRYALTQFHVTAAGKCDVYDDAAGFFELPAEHGQLTVKARLWDTRDNVTDFIKVMDRAPSAP